MKSFRRCVAVIACLTALAAPAGAQEDPAKYPTRAIHVVVGFTPGGGNDLIARIVGQKLSESLGQAVVIDNKPGGGAIVATEYVAKAPADGYTLLVGASGAIAINPAVYARLPYDPVKDFTPITELGSFPLILIVNAASPIKSVADLIAFAKAHPKEANYSSSSAAFQLVTELFKQKTGAPLQEIPYKGANDSVMAVISGQVTATIADAGPVSGQVKGGQVRALAVTSPARAADFPDVPTMKEAGTEVDAVLWSGIFVPRQTPPAIVKKLEAELRRIIREPDVVARLKPLGISPVGNSSDEFARTIADDIARWTEVARAGNIKIEQ
ncbi:MAG TPA: tripartite tricarboxylate transporter substrate binding protein [Bradyrhizobium sp.]|uniref:Bug family tripartite tricarboxylate transporter substrate binding protein n=1 Tax=Bradyrhizobium sp. TaxID=376 RepID=UPI002D80917E|nr:tripartite tricarboxylate transporter substrate binding protein [Bradyrhizobium sp.]HET7886964.1 tripartite tricarboxylate transporter substrate binding protein [Bradyrhizobium sp.]